MIKQATQEQINNQQICSNCKYYSLNEEPFYEACNKTNEATLMLFTCEQFDEEDYNWQFSEKVLKSKLFKHNREKQ